MPSSGTRPQVLIVTSVMRCCRVSIYKCGEEHRYTRHLCFVCGFSGTNVNSTSRVPNDGRGRYELALGFEEVSWFVLFEVDRHEQGRRNGYMRVALYHMAARPQGAARSEAADGVKQPGSELGQIDD